MRRYDLRAIAVELIALTAAIALAGLLYGEFFAEGDAVVRMALAPVPAVVAAYFGWRRRWRLGTRILALVIVVFATGYVFAFVGTDEQGAGRYLDGIVDGWATMLTIGIPADTLGELLTAPVLLGAITGAAGAWAVLDSRSVMLPLAAPPVAFVGGLLLTADRDSTAWLVSVLFVLALGIVALSRASRELDIDTTTATAWPPTNTSRRQSGRFLIGLPGIVAIAAFAAVAASVLPVAAGDDRFDPRDHRRPPLELADSVSPLTLLRGSLAQDPPIELFDVRAAANAVGGLPIDRVRTAALDVYDGSVFGSDDEFLLAGSELPDDGLVDAPRTGVGLFVVVKALDGPWLPHAGRPVRVDATRVGFDATSGVLVTDEEFEGFSYTVFGLVLPGDVPGIEDAEPATGGPSLLPAGLPPDLRTLAQEIVRDEATPVGQLRAIEEFLRESYPYDPDARPGHSIGSLSRFLLGEDADRAGYAEQSAASFAVLARVLGMPTRVAVGYLLSDPDDSGIHTITTADAHAWPEVLLDGLGWVPFEPTDLRGRAQPDPPDPEEVSSPAGQFAQEPPEVVPPAFEEEPALDADEGAQQGSDSNPLWLAIAVLVAVVVAFVGLVVGAKHWRRRRRRRGNPARQIAGAWREASDHLRETGVRTNLFLTADEIVDLTSERFSDDAVDPLRELAPIVTRSIYSESAPEQADADAAWDLEASVRRGVADETHALARLRATLDPRPLLTRTGTRSRS